MFQFISAWSNRLKIKKYLKVKPIQWYKWEVLLKAFKDTNQLIIFKEPADLGLHQLRLPK